MNSSGATLIDIIMSHVDEEFMNKLEAHLVGKASKIHNAPQMCSYLVQQNLLDEEEFQLKTTSKVQRRQWAEKALKAACSKKAIGSLVMAFQRSGNERILEETLEFLKTPPPREKYYPIAVKSLTGQTMREKLEALNSESIELVPPSDGLKQVATFNCQLEFYMKGVFAVNLNQFRLLTRHTDGALKLWRWLDDEQKIIKIGVKNITWFEYDAEIIVVGTSEGSVYLLDFATLEEKWVVRLGDPVHALDFKDTSLVVVTRAADTEKFWWIDISRPDMRLLNQRVVISWTNKKETLFFVNSTYSFLYVSGYVYVYWTKQVKRIGNYGFVCHLRAPSNLSTLQVVDFITTNKHLVAGCEDGAIVFWDSGGFSRNQAPKTLRGHHAAVVSLCAVAEHLLSLDETGKLLMWSGYDLQNDNIEAPVPRVLAENFCNGTYVVSYERWFASIPRLFAKDFRKEESWYKRWFGFADLPELSGSAGKDNNVKIWTLPDLWLRTG